ncbi:MAG: metallophosphoesterase [Victivallales bacterium]|nr:metallophosphoesterase [Victivallales bacterium]
MRAIPKNRRLMELQRKMHFFTQRGTSKFHFIHLTFLILLVKWGIRLLGLWRRGQHNAAALRLTSYAVTLPDLPAPFEGFRLLFASDIHIESIPELAEKIADLARRTDYDLCLLGGDYRFYDHGSPVTAAGLLARLLPVLRAKSRVIGILGNHDEYELGLELEAAGVEMLINDHRVIERNGARLYICGIDDSNYYAAHDLNQARENIPEPACKILLSHSPDLYREAAAAGFSLYLCGHTHGGQLCLPYGIPVLTQTSASHRLVRGLWQYHHLLGCTCTGAGCSALPLRFNCPPEIILLTLHAGPQPATP